VAEPEVLVAAARTRLDAARRRVAGHFLEVLRQADKLYLQGDDGVTAGLALFDREVENIRAGQAWTAAHAEEDNQAAAWSSDYPDAGVDVLDLRLQPRERIGWLEAGLAGARRVGNRGAEGAHLGNLGNAYADLGEPRRAMEYYEHQLVITKEIGDRRGEGNACWNMGLAYEKVGQRDRAMAQAEAALRIKEQIEDPNAEKVRRRLAAWRGGVNGD
jgi:tetratricopeptide (TPR) repeat protein